MIETFSCTYSKNLPDLLSELQCSLLISTYQAGKIIVISSENGQLLQLPRTFDKPMGVAFQGSKMGIATRNEVIVLDDSPVLAQTYPNKPGVYDHLFIPNQVYFTGMLSTHDMGFGNEGLIGVNTSFSCLCRFGEGYHFIPVWKPFFITDYASEDRCHLNGMALVNGEPHYVSALGQANTPGGWRANRLEGGILMNVKTQEILLEKLPMPHSPRVYEDKLYLLLSGLGQLAIVDQKEKKYQVIQELPGFTRGLSRCGDYLFIGLSRLRPNRAFGDLPLAKKDLKAGVAVVNLQTGNLEGLIQYDKTCEEIYDIQVLPQMKRPNILNTTNDIFRRALVIPQKAFWGEEIKNEPNKH